LHSFSAKYCKYFIEQMEQALAREQYPAGGVLIEPLFGLLSGRMKFFLKKGVIYE